MVFADAAMPPEDESSVGPGAGASTETVSQESSSIMSWAWDGVVEAWNTGVAWIKWAVESIFETFISCLDWIIGQLIEMVLFVLDLLPTLNIPDSFNKGVTQFANFGQVMNSILPFVVHHHLHRDLYHHHSLSYRKIHGSARGHLRSYKNAIISHSRQTTKRQDLLLRFVAVTEIRGLGTLRNCERPALSEKAVHEYTA